MLMDTRKAHDIAFLTSVKGQEHAERLHGKENVEAALKIAQVTERPMHLLARGLLRSYHRPDRLLEHDHMHTDRGNEAPERPTTALQTSTPVTQAQEKKVGGLSATVAAHTPALMGHDPVELAVLAHIRNQGPRTRKQLTQHLHRQPAKEVLNTLDRLLDSGAVVFDQRERTYGVKNA